MNHFKKYTLPVLVLLSGIFLSTISAYYSILGLVSIFSGSILLITLMGTGLELAKISACLWLHKHWKDTIGFLKLYLSVAIIILMIITSLGVYGFLTKANLKQSEGVNLNLAKVTSLENNINREQTRLDLNSQQITQYNELLSKLTTQDVRRASNERRRIQSEIKVLSKESKEIAKTVDNLNTELLPYKSEINAVEVEVGTLLYISKLIYGEDYKEYLPQTLTVLTLLIIFVFDPLAIGLLIASQKSFGLITKKEINSRSDEKQSTNSYSDSAFTKYLDDMDDKLDEEVQPPQGEGLFDIIKFKKGLDEMNVERVFPKLDTSNIAREIDYRDAEIDDIDVELNNDEALGEEFQKVLDDNRWELYEESQSVEGKNSTQDQSRLPKRRRQNGRKI